MITNRAATSRAAAASTAAAVVAASVSSSTIMITSSTASSSTTAATRTLVRSFGALSSVAAQSTITIPAEGGVRQRRQRYEQQHDCNRNQYNCSRAIFHREQYQHHQTQRRCWSSLNCDTPYQICFVRHGQSTWNRDNRFIGWYDTPLTDDGVLEARVAGQMLYRCGMKFDEVHTSLLRRSIRTVNLILMEIQQEYIPVNKHWRLNERNYGDLVGLNKKQAVITHGKEQVKQWRRAYDVPPPPMNPKHKYHPKYDPRYQDMLDLIPSSESLKDTVDRSSVYWNEVIEPAVREGRSILVVGHENNLRSLLMKLEDIPPEEMINLNLPRAVPLAYTLDPKTLKPINPRPSGKLDEATNMLRGTWLGGCNAVTDILERDYKQVYDTTITNNLEMDEQKQRWNQWMEFVVGKPSIEQLAKSTDIINNKPTPILEHQPPKEIKTAKKITSAAATTASSTDETTEQLLKSVKATFAAATAAGNKVNGSSVTNTGVAAINGSGSSTGVNGQVKGKVFKIKNRNMIMNTTSTTV